MSGGWRSRGLVAEVAFHAARCDLDEVVGEDGVPEPGSGSIDAGEFGMNGRPFPLHRGSRNRVLSRPSPVPPYPGIYVWWFLHHARRPASTSPAVKQSKAHLLLCARFTDLGPGYSDSLINTERRMRSHALNTP